MFGLQGDRRHRPGEAGGPHGRTSWALPRRWAWRRLGGTTVVVLEQDAAAGAVSTVVLRASTDQLLDDLERAIDDGVNTYKVPNTHPWRPCGSFLADSA